MKEVIVEGRVQSVGFRALCYEVAEKLGTNCTAENLEDGSVRITISGDKAGVFVERVGEKAEPSNNQENNHEIILKGKKESFLNVQIFLIF